VYWHIDYFTTHSAFKIERVIIYPQIETECLLNKGIQEYFHSQYLFPGLGSSDCVSGCQSHMQYINSESKNLVSRWIDLHSDLNPVILEVEKFHDRKKYA
jgi:Uri superfamily endonuclease